VPGKSIAAFLSNPQLSCATLYQADWKFFTDDVDIADGVI